MSSRPFMRLCRALLLAAAGASLGASAQNFPSKPVRVLIGQPPGGVQDTL